MEITTRILQYINIGVHLKQTLIRIHKGTCNIHGKGHPEGNNKIETVFSHKACSVQVITWYSITSSSQCLLKKKIHKSVEHTKSSFVTYKHQTVKNLNTHTMYNIFMYLNTSREKYTKVIQNTSPFMVNIL